MPKTWDELLSQMTRIGRRDHALSQMAKYAPAILDDLADLRDWLLTDADRKDLMARLPSDTVAAMTAFKILDARKAKLTVDELILLLRDQIQIGHLPVLFGTYNLLQEAIKGLNSVSDLETSLSLHRSAVFEMRGRLEKELAEPNDDIPGWIRHTTDNDSDSYD